MPQPSDVYKALEKMNPEEVLDLIDAKVTDVLPTLLKYDPEITHIFAGYIFTIVGADGKVRPEEYVAIKPLVDAIFNIDSDINDIKELIMKNGFDDKDMRVMFVDILNTLGRADPDIKAGMIMLAIYISALDGDISRRERAFIESLSESKKEKYI